MAYQNSNDRRTIGVFTAGNIVITPASEMCTFDEVTTMDAGYVQVFTNVVGDRDFTTSIINTSNDANSHTKASITIATGSVLPPQVGISSTSSALSTDFIFGMDNNATGDPFEIKSQSSSINITTAGQVTYPAGKPAFLMIQSTTQTNKTGAGTAYTLFAAGTTTIFDMMGNVSGSTFTAPATGKYLFMCNIQATGATAATKEILQLVTTAETYTLRQTQFSGIDSANLNLSGSALVDMSVGDTAYLVLTVYGEATDIIDIYGTATHAYTSWSGYLAC